MLFIPKIRYFNNIGEKATKTISKHINEEKEKLE